MISSLYFANCFWNRNRLHDPAPDSGERSPAVADLSVIATRRPSQR